MDRFRHWLKRILYWVVVPIMGGPLKGCRVGLFTGSRFVKGRYGGKEIDLLLEHVHAGDVVFDLGAHVGYLTMVASKAVGNTGQVVALEPVALNLAYLRNHVKVNRLTNTQILPCAVGKESGWCTFDAGKGTGRGHLESGTGASGPQVEVVSLDELVSQGKLPAPNLIKMDIEGAEVNALVGATRIFTSTRPKLLLSTHGDEIKAKCLSLLESWNYEVAPFSSHASVFATPR